MLNDILKQDNFLLPLKQAKGKDFYKTLYDTLEEYRNEIIISANLYETIDPAAISINEAELKLRVNAICGGIYKIIEAYYKGKTYLAYNILNNLLKVSKLEHYLACNHNNSDENFYRMRTMHNNFSIEQSELLHIPFHLRGKINTQRYSIPGFPCLYLGNSLHVAWEELIRPDIYDIQVARYSNLTPFKVIDLTFDDLGKDHLSPERLMYLAQMYPIICACSVLVKHREDPFKPEYIFPQLMLQWVNDNIKFDAICYSSTHIDIHHLSNRGKFYNYVLPVKNIDLDLSSSTGFCTDLCNIFKMTEVVSWQLFDYANGGEPIKYPTTTLKSINDSIESLELIKGRTQEYYETKLGMLELYLKTLSLHPITAKYPA